MKIRHAIAMLCACLLSLGSMCPRKDCPGCKAADPLQVGCPYPDSELGPAYASGTITDPTFLILSGGASHGAWGAGVIVGWPTDPSSPVRRPEFTVVTGISTGALQATYAFLGKNYNAKLESFYTTTSDSDIYSWKPDFLVSNGLQSRQPLRQLIEDNASETVIDEVADQSNRELYVGTVNLDTSQFCPWNLSTIARKAKNSTGDTRKCYQGLFRDAIFAASGAPVIAPPVEIDSNACKGGAPQKMLHVDGGLRLRVFSGRVLDQAIDAGKRPTVYVIMNGKLATHPQCVHDKLGPIAVRAFEIMDHEALFGSLYALMYERENKFDLKLSRIPDDYCLRFPGSKFDKVKMKCLVDKGKAAWMQAAGPWETTIHPESAANWPVGCCPPMDRCPGKVCPAETGCPP